MSSSILTSISGLTSVYLTNYVNTGNRSIDTAINSILLIIVGMLVNTIQKVCSRKRFRNRIWGWWYRPKSFTEFDDQDYELYTQKELEALKTDCMVELYSYNRSLTTNEFFAIKPKLFARKRTPISNKKVPVLPVTLGIYYPFGFHRGAMVYIYYTDTASGDNFKITLVSDDTEALFTGSKLLEELVNAITAKPTETSNQLGIFNSVIAPDGSKITYVSGGYINPRRTFDTLYYDQKQELYDLLLKFKKGCMYPEKLSLDNKIGILLHGPPGTGKTGTISAIANMLGRPIQNINLTELILSGRVKDVFIGQNYKKYVMVLDEIDHMIKLSSDTLMREKAVEQKEPPKTDWAPLLAVAEGDERKKILELIKGSITKEKTKHQFDFATFLQLMDGLDDASGRVIIFCTNNPKMLEEAYPALFRPGRIDIKLCLGHCSAQMFEDILAASLILDEHGREKVRNAKLPLNTWTPLQVINAALLNRTLEKTLDALRDSPVKI